MRIISREEIFDHKIYYSKRLLERVLEENGLRLVVWKPFQLGMNQLAIIQKT